MATTQRYFNIHSHTHFSNNRFLDSMNSVHDLIVNAKKKGMAGIAITDHGVISGHIKVAKMMDADPDFFNGNDGKGTFKPVLGEEIYLDDADIIKDAVDNNKKTKFFHFVLTAKDDIGYHAIRIISDNSWGCPIENIWNDRPDYHGFFFRGMRRLPTYKDWLSKLMHDPKFNFKGHVIASTACLGSELSQCILTNDKARAKKFIKYIEDTFGKENCYFEMMPVEKDEGENDPDNRVPHQTKVNQTLWNISHGDGYFSDDTGKGIPCIISTDSHYIDHNDRKAHTIFLKSENPDRDVKGFYYDAHLYSYDDLKQCFKPDVLKEAAQNSLKLLDRYAPIWHASNEQKMVKETKENPDHPPVRLHYLQEIPKSPTPKHIPVVDLAKYAKKYGIDWKKYPYFHLFVHPEEFKDSKTGERLTKRTIRADKYYIYKVFQGMNKLQAQVKAKCEANNKPVSKAPFDDTYLSKINWELMTLHSKTLFFHEPMSAYFLTVFYAVIDTSWRADSLVGPGRGSAGEWITNYLLGITQVNSIKWHLWGPRFLDKRRNDQPDIDLDSESSRRLPIIRISRKKFGADRVLNFSTFGTQAAKSTIYSACRGLHIDYVTAQNIANLLPADERGMGNISLHDALFGNKKNKIAPAKKFIAAVNEHPGLKEALLGIGGKIRGVSEHASGVAFFNEPLTQRNATMKTNKAPGIPITQFSAHDSAYLSSMKYDILTLSALDRIHEAIRLLIRDGKIKKFYRPKYETDKNGHKKQVGKEFSLKRTYMHYFGPQALDFTSKKMFEMLFNGDVTNAFEFSSIVGRNALLTIHATDFSALVAANALMRLTVEPNEGTYESNMMKKYWGNEQPINRYVRYRDHPGAWDQDMKKAGLTPDEIKLMHKYLGRHRGVCYSQEDLMKISMSPKVANFPYPDANKLRKAVAKKDPKILESARKIFYAEGKKQGTRTKFLDYVWYSCAVPAKNYSFNLAHGVAYTIILIIEMNICARFGAIYWQTACLSVNAGFYGSDFKSPDYTKLCKAMGNEEIRDKITNPKINESSSGFIPYHNKILYGLYPIVSEDDCKNIIAHRPYKSFDDFLKKTQLPKKKNIKLIKAGAFDEFEPNRKKLMMHYIILEVPEKKRLTLTHIPKMIKSRKQRIPEKYKAMVDAYMFRCLIYGRKKVSMTPEIKATFLKKYAKAVEPFAKRGQTTLFGNTATDKGASYTTDEKGHFQINVKAFNRWFNKFAAPLKEWLKTPQALQAEAAGRRNKLWQKYCLGNKQSWEMDALGCYINNDHELLQTPISKLYDIKPYEKLPTEPKVVGHSHFGRKSYPIFAHEFIYGTVIGKNPNKALVYLLTPHGVANMRVGKWRYPTYNKKISKKVDGKRQMLKDSWFKRGTKLLGIGYKRGDNFFLNNKHSSCHDALYRISGFGKDAFAVDVDGEDVSDARRNMTTAQKLNQKFN